MDTTSRFRIDAYEATQTQEETHDRSSSDDFSAFQSYHLSPEGQSLTGVDFRCLSGKRYGMSYAYMTYIEYNPDPANERITLSFSDYKVTIRGINLIFLYESLLDRRLLWIKEVNTHLFERYRELQPANDNIPDDIPVITEIEVFENE